MKNLISFRRPKKNQTSQSEHPIAQFNRDMNRLFDRLWGSELPLAQEFFGEKSLTPSIDICEGKKNITVKTELPGMDTKDIDISLMGRRLTIKGEKKQEQESKEENYHRIERSYGYFNRSVELPCDVDPSKVEAKYKKGVLQIELKKIKESNPKRIKVTTH